MRLRYMRKFVSLLVMLVLLLALCAGCGGNKDAPEATATPAPTDLPSVTAPPADSAEEGLTSANDDAAPIGNPGQGPTLTIEDAKTAYGLMGHDVQELYNAIGEPEQAAYSASCIAPDAGAEDGLLTYDGFTVATVRFPNGEEQVYGVFE